MKATSPATDKHVLLDEVERREPLREVPVVSLALARRRSLPPDALLKSGRRHQTLVLFVPGLYLALAQPPARTKHALARATSHAKADLIELMSSDIDPDCQGVVFLPDFARVTRSAFGASQLASHALSYEVAPGPTTSGDDMLARALRWLAAWQQEEQADLAAHDAFGKAIRQRPSD